MNTSNSLQKRNEFLLSQLSWEHHVPDHPRGFWTLAISVEWAMIASCSINISRGSWVNYLFRMPDDKVLPIRKHILPMNTTTSTWRYSSEDEQHGVWIGWWYRIFLDLSMSRYAKYSGFPRYCLGNSLDTLIDQCCIPYIQINILFLSHITCQCSDESS